MFMIKKNNVVQYGATKKGNFEIYLVIVKFLFIFISIERIYLTIKL